MHNEIEEISNRTASTKCKTAKLKSDSESVGRWVG